MLKPGTLIDWKWHETLEGKEAFSSFFHHPRGGGGGGGGGGHSSSSSSYQKRRVFGLLERPLLPASVHAEEVKYKICVAGKSGVGKSASVANLCGLGIPNSHADTPGLAVNTTYWCVCASLCVCVCEYVFLFVCLFVCLFRCPQFTH